MITIFCQSYNFVMHLCEEKIKKYFQGPQLRAMKGHLISLIREKRGLWTTNKNFYRNKMMKTNDWQSVCEKMKVRNFHIVIKL